MNAFNVRWSGILRAGLLALALQSSVAGAVDPAPVQREIIPGSELMTAAEREQYRQRQRGAGTAEERERLRGDHLKAMEQRARLRGLKVSDPTRERGRAQQ